jgi:hypothetical protein
MAESTIQSAGYGVWNSTIDITDAVKKAYSNGTRVFLANNNWGGDPSPGNRKYIYIFWQTNAQYYSGVTGEGDDHGVSVP